MKYLYTLKIKKYGAERLQRICHHYLWQWHSKTDATQLPPVRLLSSNNTYLRPMSPKISHRSKLIITLVFSSSFFKNTIIMIKKYKNTRGFFLFQVQNVKFWTNWFVFTFFLAGQACVAFCHGGSNGLRHSVGRMNPLLSVKHWPQTVAGSL